MKYTSVFKSTLALLAVMLFSFSCEKDFDLINTNPNAPESVNAGLLLPNIQRNMMNQVLGEAWGIGNIVIQHTAKNQFVNEDRYLWGEINGIWNTGYNSLRDVNNILIQSEANNEQNYRGIALVMRAWIFSLITDAYGDVPYSEAIKAKEGLNYTNYDSQEQIYNGILADLTTANSILGTTGEVVAGDIIYKGDVQKWKKLANSLRVRYLMRVSGKRNVSSDLSAIVSNASANPLFQSAADNAVYTFQANAPDQFPLHTARIGSFNEFRASKTLMDTLLGLNDSRLPIFFRPTPATENTANPVYVGLPNGLGDVEALQFNGGPQFQSRIGDLYFENAVSSQGLNIAKGVVMTYAELQFLLAEAAEKGLITGSAETYYTNGINGSFAFYGLTVPAAYLTQNQVAYTGTSMQKLDKIGFQKWISLYFQGMEAWYDWRRTRIPALTPGPSNQNNNMIPVRFRYPTIEQSLNQAGYQAAVQRQGPDDLNSKMWYLK